MTAAQVLVWAPSFAPAVKAGGPARAITNMVQTAPSGFAVTVIAPDRDAGDTQPFPVDTLVADTPEARIHYLTVTSCSSWRRLLNAARVNHYDLMVLNSVWSRPFAMLPLLALRAGVLRAQVTVLLPRGQLLPGALALKSPAKKSVGRLVRTLIGSGVDYIAVTSDEEAVAAREWLPGVPTMRVDDHPDKVQPAWRPTTQQAFRLLFLGRIHPTKGLVESIQALSLVIEPVHLQIAGPVSDEAYWRRCQTLIAALPKQHEVTYLGVVDRASISELLWSSDAMILLSAGENYSHSVAEALQASCPVILTDVTPWNDAIRAGAGLLVHDRNDTAAVAGQIDRLSDLVKSEGQSRRASVRRAYESARPRSAHLFRQVLG